MAHFARIENGIVTNVIVAEQEFIDSGALGDPKSWIQTSYNNSVRGTYAGIGYLYLENLDIFIPPNPFPSWTLDEELGTWKAPVAKPEEGKWVWDEYNQQWNEDTHVLPTLLPIPNLPSQGTE
jgi:hypothetical protein